MDPVDAGGETEYGVLIATTAGVEAVPHLENLMLLVVENAAKGMGHARRPGRVALRCHRQYRIALKPDRLVQGLLRPFEGFNEEIVDE